MQRPVCIDFPGKDWHPAGGGLPSPLPAILSMCGGLQRDAGVEPNSGCHVHVHPGTRQHDSVTGRRSDRGNAEIGPGNPAMFCYPFP